MIFHFTLMSYFILDIIPDKFQYYQQEYAGTCLE